MSTHGIARRPDPDPGVVAAIETAVLMLSAPAVSESLPDPLKTLRWRFSGRAWSATTPTWGIPSSR